MAGFFKELFRSRKVPREAELGIVLITKDPNKEAAKHEEHLAAIKRYPAVVNSYNISLEEALNHVPDLQLDTLPAYALIREGIHSAESFGHRLEHALICSSKPTEIILFIEYMK